MPGREKCGGCVCKDILRQKYLRKIKYLVGQNRKLNTAKNPFPWRLSKSDHKVNFFAGLGTIKLFNSLFELIEPYTRDMGYWHGTKRTASTKIKRSLKFIGAKKNKKLQCKDEFLLVLTRLRLGLLNEHLADRFCISPTHCSNIFKMWIRLLSKTVGKLVAWLPKESVMETMPKIF